MFTVSVQGLGETHFMYKRCSILESNYFDFSGENSFNMNSAILTHVSNTEQWSDIDIHNLKNEKYI